MVGFHEVTADSHGDFVVEMQLLVDFEPFRGHSDRLIAAYGKNWTEDQIIDAPQVRVPLHHPGNPLAPAAGMSRPKSGGAWDPEWTAAVGAGLIFLSALGLVYGRRPRRH
jgi:hypothetical protein